MDHDELLDALEERLGSRESAAAGLNGFVDAVMREVAAGGRVALAGFGVFDTTGTPGAAGRARLQPRFRPGVGFRQVVNHPELLGALTLQQPELKGSGAGERAERPGPVDKKPEVRPTKTVPPRPSGPKALRFRHYPIPEGTSLSAVLPVDSPRCGIYVLHFDDGYFYVGQARDVMVRFSTHRRSWRARIVGLDFAPAAPDELDDLERRTIQHFERQGKGLVNSALVGLPMGPSPLDVIVDRVEQERWLDGTAELNYELDDRLALAGQRTRSGDKFRQLAARADYEGIRIALLMYLLDVVPWPHVTEGRFWSITSLPSTNRSRHQQRLTTLSVNNVETLVLSEVLDQGGRFLGGFINVASGVGKRHGAPVKRNHYRTVGDLDTIYFDGWQGLVHLLQQPDVVTSARQTALGLMRKGRGMMARYHDDSLADDVFAAFEQLDLQDDAEATA